MANSVEKVSRYSTFRKGGCEVAAEAVDCLRVEGDDWICPRLLAIVEAMALGLRRHTVQRKRVGRRKITSVRVHSEYGLNSGIKLSECEGTQ